MALFIAGTSLLYLTLTSIIKTGSTQNILSSLQISTQRDRTSVEQAMRNTVQLGYPGIITTVPTGKGGINGYGLGIYETILPNSVPIWGHTGVSQDLIFLLEVGIC